MDRAETLGESQREVQARLQVYGGHWTAPVSRAPLRLTRCSS
ncbi:MAG: hypothetical protein ACPIOQ_65135 [Promethearchaeia archaeon]